MSSFFSAEGQRDRISNVVSTYKEVGQGVIHTATFGMYGKKSDLVSPTNTPYVADLANEPLQTALVVTPVGKVSGISGTIARTSKLISVGKIGANTVSETTYRTSEVKEFGVSRKQADQDYYDGIQYREQKFDTFGSKTAGSLNPYYEKNRWFSQKDFEVGVRKSLIQQGVTGKELEARVATAKRTATFRGGAELLNTIGIETSIERAGSRIIGPKVTGRMTLLQTSKSTGGKFFELGFAEGASGAYLEQFTRTGKTNSIITVGSGLLGGVSASTFGVPILAASTQGKKGITRTLLGAAYFTDPYEPVGDVLGRIKIPTPSISTSFSLPSVSKTSSSMTTKTTIPSTISTSIPSDVLSTVPTSVSSTVPTSVSSTVPTSVSSTVPSTVPTSVTVTTPTAKLPLLDLSGFRGFRNKSKIDKPRRPNTGYSPSVRAIVFNIRGKKSTGGPGLRPLQE